MTFLNNKLRTFNNLFTVIVMALSIYIIVTPFLPHFQLWLSRASDSSDGFRYESKLAEDAGKSEDLAPIPEENTLVIPGIQVDDSIVEGADISALGLGGVWRRPNTSTPDQGSNTVIVAHRFSYGDPSTFYHLDKVQNGDKFAVFWNQQEYIYEVFGSQIVEPSQIEVEDPTDEPILTLYTCTPVWTAAQRLVIRAKLVSDPTGDLLTESGDPIPQDVVNNALGVAVNGDSGHQSELDQVITGSVL